MSDMNIALTKTAQGTTTPAALQGGKNGVAANFAGAGHFWEMLFGNFGMDLQNKDGQQPGLHTVQSATGGDTKLPDTNPLAMLQIALAHQQVDENGNLVIAATPAGEATDAAQLQRRIELTDNVINQLQAMLPGDGEGNALLSKMLERIQAKSDDLRASLEALENGVLSKDATLDNIPLPLLIALGLSPAEISEIAKRVEDLEEKLGRAVTVEDLIAGVGDVIPSAQTVAQAHFNTLIDSLDENTQPDDMLAAQLNAMAVGAAPAAQNAAISSGTAANGTSPAPMSATAAASALGSDAAFSGDADAQDSAPQQGKGDGGKQDSTSLTNGTLLANANKAANNGTQANNAGFPVLFAPAHITDNIEGALLRQWGLEPAAGAGPANLGSPAQAASLLTGQTYAGHAHPATNIVAATLTKAGRQGAGDTMTLQLDPPELGSVNVRLEFGKDKSVKAHILVEKPETYMMLQRDALTLERALQNAGLETSGDSLSFELARGDDFNNNGEGGGERRHAGKSGGEETEAATETTTMTWQVDAATGHVRYNILA